MGLLERNEEEKDTKAPKSYGNAEVLTRRCEFITPHLETINEDDIL